MQIEIVENSNRITVQPSGNSIVVAAVGQQGANGTAVAFIFTQSVAASTWIINHNLGFKPTVSLYTQGNHEMEGDILHTSDNQVMVYFAAAIAGFARCN